MNDFRVCKECYNEEYFTEIEVLNAGDETLDFCPGCRTVEGPTMYVDEDGKEIV